MKILIVYQEIPDKTTLFVIDMNDKEFKRYSKVAGQYLNLELSDKIEDIATELYERLFHTMDEAAVKGTWADCIITTEEALNLKADGVLITGFVL